MRVRSGHHDVGRRLHERRRERPLVDPERDELDARRLAVGGHERAELVHLVLAVRENGGGGAQRVRVEPAHPVRLPAASSRSGRPIAT